MDNLHALYDAAMAGDADAIAKLETEAERVNEREETILHIESIKGNTERVRFILREFANKNLLVKLDNQKCTALCWAAYYGHTEVVEVLIEAARHLPPSADDNPLSSFQSFLMQGNEFLDTALHTAVRQGKLATAKLLVEADPTATYIQNKRGETPIYIAVERGYFDTVKMICTTCTSLSNLEGPRGSTALHAAIKNLHQAKKEDRDVIRMIIDKCVNTLKDGVADLVGLFNKTDEDRRTILELAVERNEVDVVKLILAQNPAYAESWNRDIISLMPLIYKATDKKHTDIVELLTQVYTAASTREYNTASSTRVYKYSRIERLEHYLLCRYMALLISAFEGRQRERASNLLDRDRESIVNFVDNLGWTALHHAAYYGLDSIIDVLVQKQKTFGHQFMYEDKVSTPFHVAARKGYTSTVIRLMRLWPSSSSAYTAIDRNEQNILHLAALQSKKEMIQGILKYCSKEYKNEFVNKQDKNGDTPLHMLIRRGCYVPELMKYKGLDTEIKNNEEWTPRDLLYFEDQIINDQGQIKITLDDIKAKSNYPDLNIVDKNIREEKDVKFEDAKKDFVDKKRGQMKRDLEKYKKRNNTQIVVTALITTVAFTVGFTMPGGLYQSGELDQGLVILSKKTAFRAFMVSDALALLLSTCSLFLYFLESMYEDLDQMAKLNSASTALNIVSVVAMMLTFITGTYVVLSHSPALAITVSIIGSFFFLFVIVLLIKMVYDHQVKKKNEY